MSTATPRLDAVLAWSAAELSPRPVLPEGPPIVTLLDLLAAIQRVAGGVTAMQLPFVVDRRTGRRIPSPPTRHPKRRKRR